MASSQVNEQGYRRRPAKGDIIRIPLADATFCYGCVVGYSPMWIYDFRTVKPAVGTDFFERSRWKRALRFFNLPPSFVTCGRLKLEGEAHGIGGYLLRFYEEFDLADAKAEGWAYPFLVQEMDRSRAISKTEIDGNGYHKDVSLTPDNYKEILRDWMPQMELREVPEKFIDRRDLAEVARKATPKQPEPVSRPLDR